VQAIEAASIGAQPRIFLESLFRKGKEPVSKLSRLKEKEIRLIATQYRTGSGRSCEKIENEMRLEIPPTGVGGSFSPTYTMGASHFLNTPNGSWGILQVQPLRFSIFPMEDGLLWPVRL
jgi:hypothetical protein